MQHGLTQKQGSNKMKSTIVNKAPTKAMICNWLKNSLVKTSVEMLEKVHEPLLEWHKYIENCFIEMQKYINFGREYFEKDSVHIFSEKEQGGNDQKGHFC